VGATNDAIYWPCADALILASQLASATSLPSANELRQRITDLLDRMVGSARAAGVAEADIAEARYALVAFIDEQILRSTWQGRSEWMNQPLQLLFYREFTAGENFFARMRALLNQGGRETALEIYFLCLALGFGGAYGANANPGALASFSDAAVQQIGRRLPSSSKISPNALPSDRAGAEKRGTGPLVGLLVGCAIVVVALLIGLQWSLHSTIRDAVQVIPSSPATSAR
jgi:type VI secretion system protein ImpK